jgi:hypothetical protein
VPCAITLCRARSIPVTYGLVIAYAVVLLEALLFLAWAIWQDNERLLPWAVAAVVGAILLGVVAFLLRAIMNDIRQRRLLITAQHVPAVQSDVKAPDLLSRHRLYTMPARAKPPFTLCDADDAPLFEVERTNFGYNLIPVDESLPLHVDVRRRSTGFTLNRGKPPSLRVRRDEDTLAEVKSRPSLGAPRVTIQCLDQGEAIIAKGLALYRGERLVGRVYHLRSMAYLDIEEDACHEGVLAFFVAMA